MLFTPREDKDLTPPVARDLNHDMGRRAEAEQAEATAHRDLAQPKRTQPDHTGAEKRRGLLVGKALGKSVRIGCGCHHELGVSPVRVIASEPRLFTEILAATLAIIARAAR